MKIFNKFFYVFIAVSIISLCIVTCYRGGKDLKVGLYGVKQVLLKQSPYENPLDPNRPLFRYAPGFTIIQFPFLLKSKLMIEPYAFKDILPSVFAWYWAEIFALFISVIILLKLIPAKSKSIGARNLKISILMSLHLISYELANGQNKIIALSFLLLAIYLFEKRRHFLSGLAFSIAITVYIPTGVFILYFILRSRGRFILSFLASAATIFLVIPSLILGPGFNAFLLKDWYARCLKPFFFTNTYKTYMELRSSSHSLSSTLGRIFVSGETEPYKYLISPELLHVIIRISIALIVLTTLFAAWKNSKKESRGLEYIAFLTLPLIMPSYCIWYTWAWSFVFYFTVFNYVGFAGVPDLHKKILTTAALILFISTYLIMIGPLNYISVLFYGTIVLWGAVIFVLGSRRA